MIRFMIVKVIEKQRTGTGAIYIFKVSLYISLSIFYCFKSPVHHLKFAPGSFEF